MIVAGLVLLAADTSRSRAYAQALCAADLAPELTVLYGARPEQTFEAAPWPSDAPVPPGLLLPNLREPITTTAERAGWNLRVANGKSINDDSIAELLDASSATLAVYSGFGGELVDARMLCRDVSFLHAHPGWLPDRPGSTTLYYSLLEDQEIGVTCFLLEPGIDTGPIVLQRTFPFPPAGADIDMLYDGAVRAAVMTEVVQQVARGEPLPRTPQAARCAPYYVVHPVLKHLAILRLGRG